METQKPILEYSVKPPRRRWRALLMVISAAVLLAAGYRWRSALPEAFVRVQLVMDERSCGRYQASPAMVVYDEHPDTAAELLSLPGYVRMQRECDPSSPIAGYIVPAWDQFSRTRAYQPNRQKLGPRATLFAHERTTAGGERRLVVIDYLPERRGLDEPEQMGFHIFIFNTGSLFDPPECIRHLYGELDPFRDKGKASKNGRFFAGQPDPMDASRFQIPCEITGKDVVIQGVLNCKLEDDTTPQSDDCTIVSMQYLPVRSEK